MDEKGLAGQRVDHPESFGVFGVRTGKAVKDKDLPVQEIGHHFLIQGVKDLLGGGDVDLAPGDLVMDTGGVHDELVVGRASGIFPGVDAQGARGIQLALAPGQRLLLLIGRGEVPIHSAGADNAQLFQSISFHGAILLFSTKFLGKFRENIILHLP